AHLDVIGAEEPGLAQEVERLIAEREAARAARDFAAADQLRARIEALGWLVRDTAGGFDLTPLA
ncbi:MAG: CysS/YqeB C-terminal domain-containing protein, partial [Solirubrobacteraceae bacterium]